MKLRGGIFKATAVLALLAGAIIIFVYYYETAGGQLPLSGKMYTVTAQFHDPQQVLKHADVRAAGVKIGEVSNITNKYTKNGVITEIQMELDGNFAPVYRDATALVRQKTLVGENYIALTKGLPEYGQEPDHGVLPMKNTQQAVALDDILNSLTPTVRADVSSDLQELGNGLKGQGENLNEFLSAAQPTVQEGGKVLSLLNSQKVEVANLVGQAATTLQALASRTTDLRDLITGGTQTAAAIANRDNKLAQTFKDLPATLEQARTSLATLTSFSGLATPVLANLTTAVTKLHPVINELSPTATEARTVFVDLKPFLKVANPLLTKLKTFSSAASTAVPSLSSILREADPALAYIEPYYKDVGSFLENFGSSEERENTGDYIGRCLCPISAESYSGFTAAGQKLVNALVKSGGLGGIVNPSWDALRAAGTEPDAAGYFTGTYPRLQEAPPVALKK